MKDLQRGRRNSVIQISNCLPRNIEAANVKSIKRPLFTFRQGLAPEKVIVDKDNKLSDDFVSACSVIAPDKKAIAARLKEIRGRNAAIRLRMMMVK